MTKEDEKFVFKTVSFNVASNTVSQVALFTKTALHSSNPTAITTTSIIKLLDYLRYVNVRHSPRLEGVCKGYQQSTGVLNLKFLKLSENVQNKMHQKALPRVFDRYHVNPSFLVGFWIGFVSLITISAVVALLTLLHWYTVKFSSRPRLITLFAQAKVGAQNYLVQQLYCSFGDIVLFSGLDFLSTRFTPGLSILSFFVAITFILLALFVLLRHILLLRNYQKIRRALNSTDDKSKTFDKLTHFMITHQAAKTLLADFKDSKFSYQAFLLYFTLRSIIHNLVLATLFDYPVPQAAIFVITSVLMFGYVVVMRPFEKLLSNIQQICLEMLILIVNVSLLVVAITDHSENHNDDVVHNVGEIIITVNTIAKFLPIVFIAIDLVPTIRKLISERKREKVNDAVEIVDEKNQEGMDIHDLEAPSPTISKETSCLIKDRDSPIKMAHEEDRTLLRSVSRKSRQQRLTIKGDGLENDVVKTIVPIDPNKISASDRPGSVSEAPVIRDCGDETLLMKKPESQTLRGPDDEEKISKNEISPSKNEEDIEKKKDDSAEDKQKNIHAKESIMIEKEDKTSPIPNGHSKDDDAEKEYKTNGAIEINTRKGEEKATEIDSRNL